ncbi:MULTISPECIES: hypothetical protein [unclassified Ensifer]|uniref:hypothetical protein n=1 Tax=unclassified Ensifer TaxID=2633371 RepID=UPI000812D57F|nr:MULTISPECIES: hypothetical protein [unclassified Ensifer]OCO98904.1 hypothetical protein BC362_27060 [Ensifer sp. LC14]OCP04437.1 hypothetical protein BBX50_25685 [Ensifer sp. LC11]OCP04718.1 hypothetical protein BC374_25705 [Ensifer sp. LC13]OCP30542.1 hypothetical protein BC364_25720 [Ensifer sp. LC499]
MRYMVLNTIRVLSSYIAMLTAVAWFFGRYVDFTTALLFSSLYLFAFVPLPARRLWKRVLYICLAAVVLSIVPFTYFFVANRIDSVNFLLETIAIVVIFGLLGPQTFVFLLTYIALDLPIRRIAKLQIAESGREDTI